MAAAWRPCLAGAPRIADDAYAWSRSRPEPGVSYAATPGPGDSERGDLFAP